MGRRGGLGAALRWAVAVLTVVADLEISQEIDVKKNVEVNVTVQRPWALWLSGFLAAIAVVHAVPLVVREDVFLAGVQLTTTATLTTTAISLLLSVAARRFAGVQRA